MKRSVKWFMGMCLLGMMSLSDPGMAEFYKYIDENGKVRFTDNLANVPQEQRKDVEEYDESPIESPQPVQETVSGKESEVGSEGEKTKEPTDGQADQPSAPEKGTQPEQASSELEQRLLTEGEQLQQEYDALMEERAKLDKDASTRLTPAAHRVLEKKVQDYNSRIKGYDERRKAHNQAVEDYKLSGQ